MTPEEFASKIEWEGGIFEALDYGLKSTDIDPTAPKAAELIEIWRELESAFHKFLPHLVKAEYAVEAIWGDDE